jgi:hypothetical protein
VGPCQDIIELYNKLNMLSDKLLVPGYPNSVIFLNFSGNLTEIMHQPWPAQSKKGFWDLLPGKNPGALSLLKIPTLRRVNLGYGLVTFALGGLGFWMPRYLEVAKGLSLAQANLLLFGALAAAGSLGPLSAGALSERFLSRSLKCPPLGQRPGDHPGAAPGGPGHLFPGRGGLWTGPDRGGLPPLFKPGGAHRGGGERRRGPAAGPGSGLEYRGHPPFG